MLLAICFMCTITGVTTAQAGKKKQPATTQAATLKADGTPDKRFKANNALKKDGTPDMRFAKNKKNKV